MVNRRQWIARFSAFGAGLALCEPATAGLFGSHHGSTNPYRIAPGSNFPDIDFARWTDEEPLYRVFVGDKIEVQVENAPELNRTQSVGPDGRISLGMIGEIMAVHRTLPEIKSEITRAYAQILRQPRIDVFAADYAPMRVLVGGEVKTPGWVDMVGDMDALSALIAAGGLLHTASEHKAVLIRRAPDGRAMRKVIDLSGPIEHSGAELVPLRRLDILYVPRSVVGEANRFVELYINNLIPGAVLNYFTYRTFK